MARVGFLYTANIAGAVIGSLLAGFYLLRIYNVAVATYAAVGLNLVVSAVAMILARRLPYLAPVSYSGAKERERKPGALLIYIAIAVSGASALGAQVIWTRLLSLLLGVTVHTFSIILAVFLTGLGIGAWVGSTAARRSRNPRFAFGFCQILLAVAVGWTALMVADALPYWPIDPWLSLSPWFNFILNSY
jgi:spermidine synthase